MFFFALRFLHYEKAELHINIELCKFMAVMKYEHSLIHYSFWLVLGPSQTTSRCDLLCAV